MSEQILKTSHDHNRGETSSGWLPYVRSAQGGAQPWSKRTVWNLAFWSLLVAVLVTLMWGIPHVEKRLNSQSLAALNAAGVDPSVLNLRWSYRNLDVHGELPPGMSKEQLITILRQDAGTSRSFFAQGIRRIVVNAKPTQAVTPVVSIPEALPLLSVTLVLQRNTATLDGVVENVDQRRGLVDALLATGVENIHDNLEVSDIVADSDIVDTKVDVLRAMVQAVNVDNISRFFANLDRRSLDYHVSTLDRETASDVENAASVAIVNFNISGEATVAQNAVVNIDVISNSETLTLEGQVFSLEQHRRLSFAAQEASQGAKPIVDNVSVSEFAAVSPGSDARVEGLAEIIAVFKHGVSGEIKMRGNDLSLDAAVDSDSVKASLLEVAAAARGKGISVTERIIVGTEDQRVIDPVETLQQKLNALAPLVSQDVVFSSGDSTLSSDARFTLDLVSEVLTSYPGLKVEIEGHTDDVGRAAVNEELSRARASAVRQYLIEQSVEAERLVAVGYGSRMPLVANETSEGRKQNRRVHFHVPRPQLKEQ